MTEKAIEICDRLIAEAQSKIDENARDVLPSKTAEDIWLGRRIGVETVRAALLSEREGK